MMVVGLLMFGCSIYAWTEMHELAFCRGLTFSGRA